MAMARWLASVLLLCACSADDGSALPEGTLRVVDQSGAEFFWVCDEELDDCDVHRIAGVSPPLPPCGKNSVPGYGYGWWRFLSINAWCGHGDGTAVGNTDWGRYVTCETDQDCPAIQHAAEAFECRAGFCQNVDLDNHPPGPPRGVEMEALCYGDAPRHAYDGSPILTPPERPEEMERALEAACPNPSEACAYIPTGCPDPG